MKLLITSVGSLLGQNVLDSIESRRDFIDVIGINTIAKNPRNFRCDKVYKVKETSDRDFKQEFLNIIDKENPDLILPGRDEDCVFLTELKEIFPDRLKSIVPFGGSNIPKIMLDKYDTYQFCSNNHLPFAETFYLNNSDGDNLSGLSNFVKRCGFPIVAKPRTGFGSQGVYFILDQEQLDKSATKSDIILQEYLGNPLDILKYKETFKVGIPLFFQIPEPKQYASQSVIYPNGKLSEIFFTVNTLVLGRNEYIEHIHDIDVEKVTKQYAKILYENGWCGPLNIQMKQDQKGQWKAFELSPRQTGSTSGRLQLGYDEFGILCDAFIPEQKIPNLTKKQKIKGQVFKYLQDNIVLESDVTDLESKKVWKKPKSKSDT